MSPITLRETATLACPRESAWALLTDLGAMPLFTGFGPIPGIASARWLDGGDYRVGATREVHNRDGSRHLETVAALQAPALLEDRLHDFTSPLRLLARDVSDRFELAAAGDVTQLTRTFSVVPRSAFMLPLVLALRPLLRAALRRHHRALQARLEGS